MSSPASPLSQSPAGPASGPIPAARLDTGVDAVSEVLPGAARDRSPRASVPDSALSSPHDPAYPTVRETVHDRAVVRLTDAIFRDGVAELRWRLRDQILSGVRVLVVDVSAVRQLSSTAVAALLGAHRSCRARGGGVIIRNPNRRTLDLLRRTGLWRVLRPEFTDAEGTPRGDRRPEGD